MYGLLRTEMTPLFHFYFCVFDAILMFLLTLDCSSETLWETSARSSLLITLPPTELRATICEIESG